MSRRTNSARFCLKIVKLIRLSSIIVCVVLFILLTSGIFDSYVRKDATVINSQKETDKWRMPSIVVCMHKPFRVFGKMSPFDMLTLEAYENNTIDPRDYIIKTNLNTSDLLYTKNFGKCAVMKQNNKASCTTTEKAKFSVLEFC